MKEYLRRLNTWAILFALGSHANLWLLEHPIMNQPAPERPPRLYWYNYTMVMV